MKKSKSTTDSKVLPLLDRDSCFKIVAGAFKAVAKNSTVDLKSPEVITFNCVCFFASLNLACGFCPYYVYMLLTSGGSAC